MKTNSAQNNRVAYVLEEARRYTSLGFSIMPLGAITRDLSGKKNIEYPKDGWKKYQEVIASPGEITSWNCKNIGIVTGKVSGLLVLDADSYKENFNKELLKSFNLPVTPVQKTASGGEQYFFKLPKGTTIKNDVCIGTKESGIDIRGDGGMVIAPPSTTSYGEYTWLVDPSDTPLADIPPKLLELLTKDSANETRAKKTLPELVGLKEGEGRNNAMASFIGKLLITVPIDNWNAEIWPMAQEINRTYLPPLQEGELRGVYESITKIERKKRLMLNNKGVETETIQYIPAMTHAELLTKDFPPARYTLEPFFEQGTMNMVSAPPNTWKSWLLFLFARHIADGTSVLGKFQTEKAGVLIVNEEDSSRLIKDRLILLGITDSSLPIYYRVAHGSKLKDDFVDSLIAEAKEKNLGVMMFDSLRSVHEADENDSTGMQGVMDLLKKISRENITVIFTHHNRKKGPLGKGDDAESTRGSSAINAAVSGHISLEEVAKDGEKYLILKHLKSKVGEKLPPFDIEIQASETNVSFQYLGEHQPKAQALNEAKMMILSALQDREELLGRKDFVELKIGCLTTIKEATIALDKEGKIKVTTRKDAASAGLSTYSNGSPNELLYSLKKSAVDELDDF